MQAVHIAVLFLLLLFNSCQTAPPAFQSSERPSLKIVREKRDDHDLGPASLKDLALPQEQLGYVFYDPKEKKIIAFQNANQFFIPASTTKILTAIAAFKILGPQYLFRTTVSHTGLIRDGVLFGDLYLKGYGDPLLKYSDLMDLALALKARGLKKIQGRFYYDESALVASSQVNPLREAWAPHNAGVSALSSEFNQFRVEWKPRDKFNIQEFIMTPHFSFQNLEFSEAPFKGETKFLYRKTALDQHEAPESEKFKENWLFSPHFVQGGKGTLPQHDPARATAEIFLKICLMQGIEFQSSAVDLLLQKKQPHSAQLIANHRSLPLDLIVDGLFEFSNNVTAELIMMTAAKKVLGKAVSTQEAAAFLEQWIKKEIPALNGNLFHIESSSGLSAKNRIQPQQWIPILQYAQKIPLGEKNFETLLPISGWKGTLQNRLNTPDLHFRIWAKTGSVNYAKSLVGYLYQSSGRKILFAVIANDLVSRAYLDKNAEPMNELEQAKVNRWENQATETIDQILRYVVTHKEPN